MVEISMLLYYSVILGVYLLFQGSKKKGGKDKHGSDTTTVSFSSADLYSKTPKKKTKPYGTDQLQSSIFIGYDLPDDTTEDEILSFLEKFQQSIIDIEVVLNEKCGNYAKVTFSTHSDAQAAMQQYNNQVTLKPWKERKESSSPPKKHVSCKYTYYGTHMYVTMYVFVYTVVAFQYTEAGISWPQLF